VGHHAEGIEQLMQPIVAVVQTSGEALLQVPRRTVHRAVERASIAAEQIAMRGADQGVDVDGLKAACAGER